MGHLNQNLTVLDIAEICGVARSTVSYWIAKKSLPAHRSGKKHLISVKDLVLFLKSEIQSVPQALLEQVGGIYSLPLRSFKKCWEYWANNPHGEKCQDCGVFNLQVEECFTARNNRGQQCQNDCHECKYFGEYYWPCVAFIHQIEKPAAIFKDLYLWSGNKRFSELCGIDADKLIGAGVEEIVHPDSLQMVISYNKRRHQGDPTVPNRYTVFLNNGSGANIEVLLTINSLKNPKGTWLAMVERKE